MTYFLDIQGFQIGDNNEFIIKELSFVDISGNHFEHYVFKPKFPFEALSVCDAKKVRWLSKYFHGLAWNFGVVEYNEVNNILNYVSNRNVIYVKGLQKVQWLRQWIPTADIINMEDFTECIDNLENLRTFYKNNLKYCFLHHKHCTTQQVYLMLYHFRDNIKMYS